MITQEDLNKAIAELDAIHAALERRLGSGVSAHDLDDLFGHVGWIIALLRGDILQVENDEQHAARLQMERAARKQARERANRERETMYVFRLGATWFVRSAAEGMPDGSELVAKVTAERFTP